MHRAWQISLNTLQAMSCLGKPLKSGSPSKVEFMLEATCDSRGIVNLKFSMSNLGIIEPWKFEGNVRTEVGQLPALAKSARQFFGASAG
jgi:hypothetical protein